MEDHVLKLGKPWLATLFLTVSMSVSASAQELSGWTQQKFADSAARLQSLPPLERAAAMTELFSKYALDQAWGLARASSGDGARKPGVNVLQTNQPIYVSAGQLNVSVQFYAQLMSLSLLVGHDAAVADSMDMPVRNPLLFKPFQEGRLLSLMPEAGGIFESDQFLGPAGIAMFSTCTSQAPECQQAQGAAIMCAAIFVLGHEVAHVRERHTDRRGGVYPLEEELLADARGLEGLQKYVRNLQNSGQVLSATAKKACLAAPVAFFELNSRRVAISQQTKSEYLRRKETLLVAMGQARDDIESLVEVATESSGGGSVAVTWSAVPSLVLIDGVAVNLAEVERLVLSVGRHRLVALNGDGLSSLEFRVSHRKVARLRSELRPFRAVGASELASLVGQKSWAEVLVSTSDSELRPKSASVAMAHWNALRGLRLGAWIDRRDMVQVSAADARQARRWRATGLPLTDWDDSLSDAVE